MDCDTARLFLQFTHPRGDDLDGPEAEELHAHLEQCTACNAQAMTARRLDQHLGRAMNAVPVPPGLKSRIVERLAEERGVFRRRWIRRIASVAAAACVLLAAWGVYAVVSAPKQQTVSADDFLGDAAYGRYNPDRANDVLRRLGARPGAPTFVEYAYLIGEPALATLPGHPDKKVPQFVFARNLPRGAK